MVLRDRRMEFLKGKEIDIKIKYFCENDFVVLSDLFTFIFGFDFFIGFEEEINLIMVVNFREKRKKKGELKRILGFIVRILLKVIRKKIREIVRKKVDEMEVEEIIKIVN